MGGGGEAVRTGPQVTVAAVGTAVELQVFALAEGTVVTDGGEDVTVGGGITALDAEGNGTGGTGIVADQEDIPLSHLSIRDEAPLGGSGTIAAVNHHSRGVAAPCAGVVGVVIAVGRAVCAGASGKLGSANRLKKFTIGGITCKGAPAGKVNIAVVAV